MRYNKERRVENSDTDTKHYVTTDTHAITNALTLAAGRFDENAKEFRKLIDAGPQTSGFVPTGKTAESLAKQFESQAAELREFVSLIDAGNGIAILHVDPKVLNEDEDEPEAPSFGR